MVLDGDIVRESCLKSVGCHPCMIRIKLICAQTRSKIQRQLGGVVVHDGNGLARETNCDYLGKNKEAFAQQQQTTSAASDITTSPGTHPLLRFIIPPTQLEYYSPQVKLHEPHLLIFRIFIFEIDKSRFGNMQVSDVGKELLNLIDELRTLRHRVFDMHVCKNRSAKKI